MSLWRLPPIVIIHLKRFQFNQHMRRKLRDFVHFPVEGLDLSRIMTADSKQQQSSPGDEEKKESANDNIIAGTNGDTPKKASSKKKKSKETTKKENMDDDANPEMNGDTPKKAPKKKKSKKKASKTEDATKNGASTDDSSSSRFNDNGRGEMLYDLYGVVHHQGALSGGHYVASLKSDDGQWRLFNDAQIYEIHSRDVVDSSAYILFYIRRDVKDLKLGDFWNTSPAREGEGLTEEEMEKLIQGRSDRCVIS